MGSPTQSVDLETKIVVEPTSVCNVYKTRQIRGIPLKAIERDNK